ncbi:MAG: phosphoribosylformylglycinamidine synthase subunit PurQ [Actinobacteria bacterium]|nr:MAG: phosphoribosylformylglycinamidine synthase subunit PurQ [Actinomycetota bacterium]
MKFGVLVFPGSNCDTDCHWAVSELGQEVDYIWHHQTDFNGYDCLILPGGFSYGDFLRSGAIARFSPVMKKVKQYAQTGGLIIGICNGFQILLEAGLLPGAMKRNDSLKFICRHVNLKTENNQTSFTNKFTHGQVVSIPIAHNEGSYFADEATLKVLKENNQIIFRYCSETGNTSEKYCPNGALENIAGICNKEGNVLGMMPHPERAMSDMLGSSDGRMVFESIIAASLQGRGKRDE